MLLPFYFCIIFCFIDIILIYLFVVFYKLFPGETASSPHRGPRVNAQMMTSLPSPLPSPPYPLLIESVQPKLAPEGIPIHFSGSASADQGIDIASVS